MPALDMFRRLRARDGGHRLAMLALIVGASSMTMSGQTPTVPALLAEARPYVLLPEEGFNRLGKELPDGGSAVKALAMAAPGGAFDPRQLTYAKGLGYTAAWHVVRYRYYGLDWDIAGLQLTPDTPDSALPTIAIVNGGSANWYEFFLDPLNGPGLGQYLAQRARILLITIPGNFAYGGWTSDAFEARVPAYVLDHAITPQEASVRNAIYTFSLVTEGVRQLLERHTTGPLLIVGHSTGGEMQFLLKNSSLGPRLARRSLGWGTGGPASLTKAIDEAMGERPDRVAQFAKYPRVDRLRARDAAGYISSQYVGPLNPIRASTPLDVARGWFVAENRRRPQFKQVLQDMEHQGMVEHRARVEREIRETLASTSFGVNADEVVRDLFSTMSPPLDGYDRMAWVVGRLDNGHWDPKPSDAREYRIAEHFRRANPNAAIRVLAIDAPITHYGHIERPRQLADVLIEAARWVVAR